MSKKKHRIGFRGDDITKEEFDKLVRDVAKGSGKAITDAHVFRCLAYLLKYSPRLRKLIVEKLIVCIQEHP